MAWVVSPTERRRRSVVQRLEVGDSVARVVQLLGQPGARCAGSGSLRHLEKSFPAGWPGASVQTALQALGRRTTERWVYTIRGRRASCNPRDGQTELGVGADGHLVWYVAVTGKTSLVLPPSFSPARPDGTPGQ